ncbi:response regulator [Chitinophaga sp. 22321]|nr:response regulator [Chitinophaga hostae]
MNFIAHRMMLKKSLNGNISSFSPSIFPSLIVKSVNQNKMTMKIRILHAEDDMFFAAIVRKLLHQQGFEVSNAYNGKDAWLLFNEMKFDYCLLDIMMPGLNGIDLGERIRNANSQMPIYYLSGEEPALVQAAVFGRGGGTAYFNKTFNIRKLSDCLLQYFNVHPIKIYDDSYRQIQI